MFTTRGPLEKGTLEGYEITCPLHYAVFDIRNGKVSDSAVWATDLEPYEESRIIEQEIFF